MESKVTTTQVNEITKERKDLLINTVAKGATNDEFIMFMHLADKWGLDPFAKEIWFIKYQNNPPIIMTSIAGYYKIANDYPTFDNVVCQEIKEGDIYQMDSNGNVTFTMGATRGKLIGAYASVFRKDRNRPTTAFVELTEYSTGKNLWASKPSTMIKKVAESVALRKAFNFSGLYTQEEMDENYSIHNATNTNTTTKAKTTKATNEYQEAEVINTKSDAEIEAERIELERIEAEKTLDYENSKEAIIKIITNPLIDKAMVDIVDKALQTKDAGKFGTFFNMLQRLSTKLEEIEDANNNLTSK